MTERLSATMRERRRDLIAIMERFEWDMAHDATMQERIPDAWREVWQNRTRKKAKMSFWIDEDVVKFFRSMGPGYGPRMNDVLRGFMLARLSGLLEGEDLPEKYREKWMGKRLPSLARGDVELARGR